MKILFAADVDPDPNSGAAGTEWQTIQALRSLGHDVDEIWARDLGRTIAHGNLHYLLELPRAYRRVINDRCTRRRYDVLHVNQGHCYLAARDHRARKRPGVFVCRSHGLDDYAGIVLADWRRRLGLQSRRGVKALLGGPLDYLLHRHDRLAYAEASGIIVSSSSDQRHLLETMHVPQARVARIAQAPAMSFVSDPALEMTDARRSRILHVGGFAYWKGVHAVAQVANSVLGGPANVEMTWVCRRDDHPRVRELLSPEANAAIRLVDWVPQDQLRLIFDQHGIFLCPSLFEGFGKAFLEAMARGLCVIGTPAGGMPDVITNGKDGFIVEFNSASQIVDRFQTLQSNSSLAFAMSRDAAERAREYSWHRVAQETAAFYEELSAACGP